MCPAVDFDQTADDFVRNRSGPARLPPKIKSMNVTSACPLFYRWTFDSYEKRQRMFN